jgi:RimJ/RimL family protein N-acetyltransferase
VTRYLETGTFPTTQGDLERFYESVQSSPNQVIFAIEERKNGLHIGNVKLGPIHWVNRSATLGILIGEKAYWGRGLGAEATQLMVEYGFFRLNLNRINLGVFAEYETAIRCYTKVGFKIEGRFRQALFRDGEYKDHLWMGLLRSEYSLVEREKRHTDCYVYLAASGPNPVAGGYERMLASVRKYARAHGIKIAKIFREENVSGETDDLQNRPALRELLSALHVNGVELVLVESLDTLGRDLMIQESVFARIEPYGFELRSVTEPEFCTDSK